MCVYCAVPDMAWRHIPPPGIPPWTPSPIDPYPFTTTPVPTPIPWTREMLAEFEDLIKRVKDLEKKVSGDSPCFEDPRKMEFIKHVRDYLDKMEKENG